MTLTDAAPHERLRIAVLPEPPGGATDPGIAAAVRRAADALSDHGHDVVELGTTDAPPHYEEIMLWWAGLLAGDVAVQEPLLRAVMGRSAAVVIEQFLATAPPTGPAELFGIHLERHRCMREWSEFFSRHPVLLSPTWSLPAFEHDADLADEGAEMTLETFRAVLHPNFLGLPAAVVPAGLADGLPVGVQVIGDRFTDLRCLRVAEQIEETLGTLTPIDPAGGR